MCWSSQVSFAFALLDLTILVTLLWRRRESDYIYAVILVPLAGQEICQMILWVMEAPSAQTCYPMNRIFSFFAVICADMVPIPVLVLSSCRRTSTGSPSFRSSGNKALFWGWTFWILQAIILWISVFTTRTYCVGLGPNHHQIWIGDKALYEFGGYTLYLIGLGIYVLVCDLALVSVEFPGNERFWMLFVVTGLWLISSSMYYRTLESGSIYCWSSFFVGLYALFKSWLKPRKYLGRHVSK